MTKYLKFRLFFKRKKVLNQLKKRGTNFIFDPLSTIPHPEFISIGDNVFIGEKAHISAKVDIGNNVMFGPRPIIIGGDHYFGIAGKSIRFLKPQKDESLRQIIIEDETWFGAGVIILGGVKIGIGAVIGAGSVITKSIPPFTLSVGTPAKPVKLIFTDKMLEKHLKILGYDKNFIQEVISRRKEELTSYGLSIKDFPVLDRTSEYKTKG